ncbi:hypothetical protein AB0C81_17960 [Streptomyces roseoverticillatus]|uniref:hypothetical protein n=1 Tax=Streptomyces roseoverticillatus TaxID=66429 RepID=UPI0033CA981A
MADVPVVPEQGAEDQDEDHDQGLMDVLRWQQERQQYEKPVLGNLWVDNDLVFARDSFKLFKQSRAGGPQDPEKDRGLRERPAQFRARVHHGALRPAPG